MTNQYSWFFAIPVDVPDDLTVTNKWVKYLQNNSDSVFKISGMKGKADCDYWGKDHCVENISVEAIEVLDSGKPMRFSKKQKNDQEPIMSRSVCDDVLKSTILEPVTIFEGKPAKVNFTNDSWLYQFRTTVSEQVAEGPNFAGHFTFVRWGCGTDCLAYAIIDTVTGNRVLMNDLVVENLQPSFDIDSRLLVFNSKDALVDLKGMKLNEIEATYNFLSEQGREYYELVEEKDGSVWMHKLCTENILDGIYSY